MRLESIALHGFKSFGEKARLKVLPGITGIVGPNGCGKCLTGDTPVLLADGRLVPIRDLVEDALVRGADVERFDDGVAVRASGGGVDVLSLDTDTMRLGARPVQAFIRRSAPPFLLRVRTRAGREVVTTHYHPFFSLRGGALDVLTAEQLVAGVRIAVPRSLPVKPAAARPLVDQALTVFRPEDRIYVRRSRELDAFLDMVASWEGGIEALAKRAGVSVRSLRARRVVNAATVGAVARLAEPLSAPVHALTASGRGQIRVPMDVDERLARFLGYLIAEGRTTRSGHVWFVNSDEAVTAEFAGLAEGLFGVAARRFAYKPNATGTIVFSRALCVLLDRVFQLKVEGGSADKVVPPQIFEAPDAVVAGFLSGLFEGDGYVHRATSRAGTAMPYLEYATASRRLAEGVVTLLLRLGVFALLRRKEKYAANTAKRRRRTYWSVYVYGVDQMRRLGHCLRFVGARRGRLEEAQALEVRANPNLDVVPGAAEVVRAAVRAAGISVKRLRSASPRLAAYAEGRCEPSRGGLTEVADLLERHGTATAEVRALLRRLRALASSDVCWDTVVAVERVAPADPWVYDLTVGESHNFVAANVVVHNSNISEAVRWALGEQSAKSLRGQRMEDLIFHGSASRKAVGLAEIELTFANDGTLSVPWSEISVIRRLYRTGESEYLLNKAPSRLRDILDLFAGTGANPRAYSVMDQDKLNHVLTAKPHERRIFVEEAAGIARYKQQRNETQGKLDASRQNLLRVRDVMDEVKRQLGSLERQARKAQQYKTLDAERRELGIALAAAEFVALTAEAETIGHDLVRLRDGEHGLRSRLGVLAAAEAERREAIQRSDHGLADLRQALQKVQGEVERLLERREQMGVQLREMAEESVRVDDEIRLTADRLQSIVGERETGRGALDEAERVLAAHRETTKRLETAAELHRASLAGERERFEALRLEQVRLAGQRTDLVRSAGELRERQVQLTRRAERLAAEHAAAEAEAARLLELRATTEAARDQAVAELAALAAERTRLGAHVADRETARATAVARLGEARLALAAQRSSLESLSALERAREGYGAGVRAIFAEGGPALSGIVGTVADLLDVPSGLERAVEAVLGERLEWVVVERFEQARAAVGYLGERGAGAATFLPLEHLPVPDAAEPEDGGVRWATGEVGATSRALLHHLLGRVGIVQHLDDAEALWRRNGIVATYVTAAGEVLGPTGHLRGGVDDTRMADVEHSLLARKRRIRELEDEVSRLEREVANGQAAVTAIEGELAELRARVPLLDRTIANGEAARVGSQKDLEQLVREHERVGRHRATVQAEAAQVGREADETGEVLGNLEARIAAAQEAERRQESVLCAVRQAIEAAEARDSTLVSELTASRVQTASVAERVEALGRELTRLDEIEADLTTRLAQARQRKAQTAERSAWLAEERNRANVRAQDVAVERDRLEQDARVAAEQHEGLLAELRAVEGEARSLQGELGRLTARIHELDLRATERRVRAEEAVQEARRAWALDATELLARHDPGRDLADARQRVSEIEEKLTAIGAVNLVADEEYRELEERLTFLRTQYDDLTASIKDMEKALRGMTRTAQDRFAQAFQEVNERFKDLFQRLFEGGSAELRLVEPEEGDDPLDTGIELMAQPRGKRLQSVTLMSGGERALTGLALLFAIFYYRPSPFCVLDEVDAPLDDANIHRFLRVLRELTSQTQFLVITHNRKTMEAADVLYGVTMQEPGLSKLVSVNLTANGG